MKKLLIAVLSGISFVAQATSPIPPALNKNFKIECEVQIAVLSQLLNPVRGNGIEVYKGLVTLTLKDLEADTETLAKKIRWQDWDNQRSRPIAITLDQVKGKPVVSEFEFYAMGASDNSGKIGNFSVTLGMDYNSEDNVSKIGVKTEADAVVENNTARARSEAEASQSLGNKKVSYSTTVDCFLKK